MSKQKQQVYRPVYTSPPNTFLRYEVREFDDGAGHCAKIRYALFLDKNAKQKEMVAQVMWYPPK